MKYIEIPIELISTYKLPDFSVNPPKDNDHWLKRYIYVCEILKDFVKTQKKLSTFYLNIIGRLKDIGTGEYIRLVGDIPKKYDEEWEEDYNYYNYNTKNIPKPYPSDEEIRKEKLKNNTIEDKFIDWMIHSHTSFGLSNRKSKNPQESFEKMWPKLKEIINGEIEKEKTFYKNTNFLDRVMGQSSPRLSFKDQIYVRKNLRDLSLEIKEFVFGKIKNLDFSNEMTLNTITDFYEYPKLPTGGRIAQTIPDTLLLNYYNRMKENTLANGFSTDDFMNFISRFISNDVIKKWSKQGTVYRYGKTDFKNWFPASTELKGVLTYIRQTYRISSLKFPLTINYGNVSYFDLYNYIRYIQKELEYTISNDIEKEVLIHKSANLNKVVEIPDEKILYDAGLKHV